MVIQSPLYRIKRLQESNILHGFMVLINTKKIGLHSKVVGIKTQSVVNIDDIIKQLQLISVVIAIRHCGGIFDLIITITGKELPDCYTTLQNLLSDHNKYIKHYQLLDKLDQRFLGVRMLIEDDKERKYLDNIKENKGSSFQTEFFKKKKDISKITLDEHDQKIIDALKLNSRISLAELSTTTNLSLFQLQQRIRRMITEDVITGFFPHFSLAHLGLQHHTVMLNVHKDSEKKFHTWTEEHPYVVWRTKYLGQYNYKLTVYARNNAHLSDMLQELISEFGDSISHVETLPIFRSAQYIPFIR